MTLVAVSYGNSFVVVFCWAWPRSSCCFVALETKRKSGWGICGSSLFVLLWFCVMICHFHRYRPIALCTAFFTAYVVIRTVPQSIHGQTRGKKKRLIVEPGSHDGKRACTHFWHELEWGSLQRQRITPKATYIHPWHIRRDTPWKWHRGRNHY